MDVREQNRLSTDYKYRRQTTDVNDRMPRGHWKGCGEADFNNILGNVACKRSIPAGHVSGEVATT